MTRLIIILVAFLMITVNSHAQLALTTQTYLDVSQAYSYTAVDGTVLDTEMASVSAGADAEIITKKCYSLIRYLVEKGESGTLYFPAGTWRLNKPLLLNAFSVQGQKLKINIKGAGKTQTILKPAAGYEDMTVLYSGNPLHGQKSELNASHRMPVMVYDTSVTESKSGFRSISQPTSAVEPPTLWAANTDYSTDCNSQVWVTDQTLGTYRNDWIGTTNYVVGDVVLSANIYYVCISACTNVIPGLLGTGALKWKEILTYECTQTHTSDAGTTYFNRPGSGTNWHAFWRQVRVVAGAHFWCSPLAAGPLDAAKNYTQATYWENNKQLTLDMCVQVNNNSANRGVLFAVTNDASEGGGPAAIMKLAQHGSDLKLFLTFPPGVTTNTSTTPTQVEEKIPAELELKIVNGLTTGAVHRFSIQMNFDPDNNPSTGDGYVVFWMDGVQKGLTGHGYTNVAKFPLQVGARLNTFDFAQCYILDAPIQYDARYYNDAYRGIDQTCAGFKMSNIERYMVKSTVGALQEVMGGGIPLDNNRYFTNDDYTIAYLPLDDEVPNKTDYSSADFGWIRIKHGTAATILGNTPAYSFGKLESYPTGDLQFLPSVSISDLTIEKSYNTLSDQDAVYGSCVSYDYTSGIVLKNVILDGGFNALDVVCTGINNYVTRLTNVTLDGSQAGYYANGSVGVQVIAQNVNIPSPGRRALSCKTATGIWENLTIGPSSFSDYLIYDTPSTSLSNKYVNLTIQPDPNHQSPTKGVFFRGYSVDAIQRLFYLENVQAMNLPPNIAFIDMSMRHNGANCGTDMRIKNVNFSVYNNGKLSAFIRGMNPRMYGTVEWTPDFLAANGIMTAQLSSRVSAWLEPGAIVPWHKTPGTHNYKVADAVTQSGKIYWCIADHVATDTNKPGVGASWTTYWKEAPWCNMKFIYPDYTTLPLAGKWVQASHYLQFPNALNGYYEYRCVQSGDYAETDHAKWPKWAPIISTDAPSAVSISSPVAGNYPAGTTFTLVADGYDSDGIAKVEFYYGATKIGEAKINTINDRYYSCQWTPVNGIYNIKVKIYDNHMRPTESASVTITVGINGPILPVTNNLAVWLRPEEIASYSDGATLTNWAACGPTSVTAAKDGANAAPVVKTNIINGYPVARFTGSNYLKASNYDINTKPGLTIITVSANSPAQAFQTGDTFVENPVIGYDETGAWGRTTVSPLAGEVGLRFGTGQANNSCRWTRPASTTGFTITATTHNINPTGTDNLFVDGTKVATFTGKYANLANNASYFLMGKMANRYFTGDVAEVLVYDISLSDAEVVQVTNYLKSKYHIIPNLPVTNNLAVWLRPEEIASYSDGATLTNWAAGGSTSVTAAKDGANAAPVVKTNIINGYPVARFTGSNYLKASNYDINTKPGLTIITVSANSPAQAFQTGDTFVENPVIGYDETGSWGRTTVSPLAGEVGLRFGTGQANNTCRWTRPASTTGFTITATTHNTPAETDNLFVDGTKVATFTGKYANLANNASYFLMGKMVNRFFTGDVAEVLVYGVSLTDAEIQDIVNNYLKVKYAL